MHKLFEMWIRIPRSIKQIFLSSIILIFVVYWGLLGSRTVIQLVYNINLQKIIVIIISFVVASILYVLLKEEKKAK